MFVCSLFFSLLGKLSRFLVGEDSPLSVGLGTTLVYEKWLAFMRKRKGKLSDFSNRHSKSSQCMELSIERSLCSTSPPSISTRSISTFYFFFLLLL